MIVLQVLKGFDMLICLLRRKKIIYVTSYSNIVGIDHVQNAKLGDYSYATHLLIIGE